MPKKITPETEWLICSLVNNGMPLRDVRVITSTSIPTIYRIIHAAGIEPKNAKKGGIKANIDWVGIRLCFGDRYHTEAVKPIEQIRAYFDASINHEVRVFPTRFSTGYKVGI